MFSEHPRPIVITSISSLAIEKVELLRCSKLTLKYDTGDGSQSHIPEPLEDNNINETLLSCRILVALVAQPGRALPW